MIVYYQVTKNQEDRVLYRGEDTYPYATPDTLIVADGLGGRGGYAHTKIDKNLLNEDTFYDVVFKPVFEKETDDEFKKYVSTCFREVFETKEYYFDIPDATRTSGYFASRFVSCIVAYELSYDKENFDREKIFEAAKSADPNVLQAYGDKLSEIVKDKLKRIADAHSFELESNIAGSGGSYLLPTTLQAAIIKENEDSVDAVYFWAGDSRAYAWDKKDGMAILNEDHEDEEIMTNLISLTKPFRIETRFFNMKKPCALFNASDGCYKGMSALELEYTFLSSISTAVGYSEAAKLIEAEFDRRTKHDDSNTMAMWTFGYEDYISFKKAANERLDYYKTEVFAKVDDVFDQEYELSKQRLESEADGVFSSYGARWIDSPSIKDFIAKTLVKDEYAPFLDAYAAKRQQKKADFDTEKETYLLNVLSKLKKPEKKQPREEYVPKVDLTAKIPTANSPEYKWALVGALRNTAINMDMLLFEVKEFIKCAQGNVKAPLATFTGIYAGLGNQHFAGVDIEESDGLYNFIKFYVSEYKDKTWNELTDDLRDKAKSLEKIFSKTDEDDLAIYKKRFISLTHQQGQITSLYSLVENLSNMLKTQHSAYRSREESLSQEIIELRARITKKSEEERLKEEQQEREARKKAFGEASAKFDEEHAFDDEGLKRLVAKDFVMRYWRVKRSDLIGAIWANRSELLSAEEIKAIEKELNNIENKYAETKEKAAARDLVYENYEKTYKRFFKASALKFDK